MLSAVNWMIVGAESGPGARPMEEAWVVSQLDFTVVVMSVSYRQSPDRTKAAQKYGGVVVSDKGLLKE